MMLFIRNFHSQTRSLFVLSLFLLTSLTKLPYLHAQLHSSNIEIIPKEVNLSVSTVANFICINHQQFPSSPLEVNLSKHIPPEQIKLSKRIINQTTISIQLQLINYVGYFHLLCYVKGEQSQGNLADIYVKDVPGLIQFVKPCRVYNRKYMKCKFEAPTIARALQNDYPGMITFSELPSAFHRLAYKPRVEFFKNDSTDRYLVYVWKPNTEGVFPDQITMRLQQHLEFFESTEYRFTLSRVFVIESNFTAETSWNGKVKIDLTQLSSPVFCRHSARAKKSPNVYRIWTSNNSTKKSIIVDDCSLNTICEVCLKCREEYSDPDGPENCIEIKTSALPIPWFVIAIIIFYISLAAVIIVAIILTKICRKNGQYSSLAQRQEFPLVHLPETSTNPSENDPADDLEDDDKRNSTTFDQTQEASVADDKYTHITEQDVHDACDAKVPPLPT